VAAQNIAVATEAATESTDADAGIVRRPTPGGWGEAGAVGGLATLVYALTLSHVPALTPDGPTYLLAIEDGGGALYHPHHLAYNAVAWVWLYALGAIGLGGDPLPRVELLNALAGACAAALVWTLLRRRAGLGRGAAAAATAGAALSGAAWLYSVAVEVYMLPLALLLATLLVLTTPRPGLGAMAGVGLLNGLAVLMGQSNVLFGVVVVVVIVRGADRRTALARLAAYGASAVAVTAGAYGAVLAFVLDVRPLDWLTSYAQDSGYWHLRPDAPAYAAFGATRALIGGSFAFRLGAVRDTISSRFPGRSLDDEAFLVRHVPPVAAGVMVLVAVAGAALLVAALVGAVRRRRDLTPAARRLALPLLVWLAVYSAFFLIWNPENLEFWIPQVTLLWMLAAVGTATAVADPPAVARRRVRRLAVAAGAVALVSGLGTILPASRTSGDVYATRYRALAHLVGPGDLVVVDRPYLGVWYTRRYTEATPVPARAYIDHVPAHDLRPVTPSRMADRAAAALADGHTVVLDADALEHASHPLVFGVAWELAGRFGPRWREVPAPDGLPGWFVISPP